MRPSGTRRTDVAVVTMASPPLNILTWTLRAQILAAVRLRLPARRSAWCAWSRSAARVLAGADIDEFRDTLRPAAAGSAAPSSTTRTTRSSSGRSPSSAASAGTAGRRTPLAMAGDLRMAAADAVFGQPEIGLGCFPRRRRNRTARAARRPRPGQGAAVDRTSVFRRGGAQLGPGDGGGRRRELPAALGRSRARSPRGRRGPFRRSRPWSTRPRAPAGRSRARCPRWRRGWKRCTPVIQCGSRWQSSRNAGRPAAARRPPARPTRKAGAKVDRDDVDWHGYWVAAPTAFDADLAIDERAFRASCGCISARACTGC